MYQCRRLKRLSRLLVSQPGRCQLPQLVIHKRQKLLGELDTAFKGMERDSKLVEGLDQFAQQAYDMISSPKARKAFDTSQEKPEAAAAFGEHRFGMSCLLATRLIEAGVRFVTVTFGGWDTHGNNFRACKDTLLPQLDQ